MVSYYAITKSWCYSNLQDSKQAVLYFIPIQTLCLLSVVGSDGSMQKAVQKQRFETVPFSVDTTKKIDRINFSLQALGK